jgi:branched-chain amino acid transport system substrate-binding protein
MRRKRVILGIVVFILGVLLLAACTTPETPTEEPEAAAPAEEEAVEPTEEPAAEEPAAEEPEEEEAAEPADEEPIKVGGSLSLTGFLAPTAMIHKVAGDLFVEQLNASGGLLGRPVEWVLLDDESVADNAAALYERLITEDEVDLIIGPYGTGNITAAMNVAERFGYVFPHHTASLTYAYTYPWHFPLWYTGLNTHITTPDLLYDALDSTGTPPETIAFVTNQFPGTKFLVDGRDGVGGAAKVAEEHGYEVVLNVDYPLGNTDFGPIAAQVRDADPDFLYIGGIGVDANSLVEAMQALDYLPPGMFVQWPAPGPVLNLGEAAEGMMSVTLVEEHEPFLSDPEVASFAAAYKEAATEAGLPYPVIETQAAVSWAAWQILTKAVEATGSLDQETIANWLLSNTIDTVIGPVSFDPEQQNYGPDLQKIKQVRDGVWLAVYPEEFAPDGLSIEYSPEG